MMLQLAFRRFVFSVAFRRRSDFRASRWSDAGPKTQSSSFRKP